MEKFEFGVGEIFRMTEEEARTICKKGKGKAQCSFLEERSDGTFICVRGAVFPNIKICKKLKEGHVSQTAKGRGGWNGCAHPNKGYKGPIHGEDK